MERISKLQGLLKDAHIKLAAFNAGVDLQYFTGLNFHLSERPVVLLVPQSGKPCLIFPEFEISKAISSKGNINLFPYSESIATWPNIFKAALDATGISGGKVAVAPESMRFLEMDLIQSDSEDIGFISCDAILKQLKGKKDFDELDSIQIAVSIAESALINLLKDIKVGQSEKEIANNLVIKLLQAGSEPELPFSPIVASGPNSANPHAVPSERRIVPGDILLIDWGARSNGYVSDLTRCFFVCYPDVKFMKIAEIVLAANEAARAKAKPGILASEVDRAARDLIELSGYGENFTHRTGHGIGLLAHEAPYISADNMTHLEHGNTFTIEPGIYIQGLGGVRIEDNLFVDETECKTLTSLPRELKTIDG
jgi:Xaa-Pro dipeptidase